MLQILAIAAAGFVAGGMNALAGGGSFVSFPVLVWVGLPPIIANASSTVALVPGALASAWAYRKDVRSIGDAPLPWMFIISMIAGGLGAILLLSTPESVFSGVVPWLLLTACLMFIFGGRLGAALRKRFRVGSNTILICQFFLGLYGGYFGGAVGIMAMAIWGLIGDMNFKEMNPAKVVLVGSMNCVAVVFFVFANVVRWHETLIMLVAAALGGYGGAQLSRKLAPQHIRATVICISAAMTAWYFYQTIRGGR